MHDCQNNLSKSLDDKIAYPVVIFDINCVSVLYYKISLVKSLESIVNNRDTQ